MALKYQVLIIGAGPAGLVTAHALRKVGISCAIFEQDVGLGSRSRDWNFGIYWAQNPLSDCLPEELYGQIAEFQVDDHIPTDKDVLPIYHGQTGELLKAIPAPLSIRLHRTKFLHLLSTGLDIQYDKKLSHIDSDGTTATASFKDGTSASGNLIIGAEGAHSVVREYLVGKEDATLEPAPIVASATITTLPEEAVVAWKKLHHRNTICFHPQGQFLWLGDHQTKNSTPQAERLYMVILSWSADAEHDPAALQGSFILRDLKERAAAYAEPFKTLVNSIPEGTKCWHNRLSSWAPRKWDNRNSTVTVVGDAAHSMTFHRGQGLNNAIHDAASLAACFRDKGIPLATQINARHKTAVDAYEDEMRVRGAEAVHSNLQNSIVTHDFETLMQSPLFTSGVGQKVVCREGGQHR